jgi:hypothetical protein
MKQLQLLFITLFIVNILPAQELQWHKHPKELDKKTLQDEAKDFLYEDEDNIYFSLPRGKGELHYREQVYVGYVRMDKSSLETELIVPTYKEIKNGVSLHFPFNGKSYSIIKERGKKNESARLSYYTADNPTSIFIKNIDSFGKQNPKDATFNGSITDNRSTVATNSIAYSPDGNHLLLVQYYFSTNIVDVTILDHEMNLVLDHEIILSNSSFEFKEPVINSLFLDDEDNITILWEGNIDIEGKTLKKKSDIISYYDRNKGEVQHKIFPFRRKNVQSVQYAFKAGELNIVAVIGKVRHKMNPIPNANDGIDKKSLLIGRYDIMNNEWEYEMNDSIIKQLFDDLDIEKEDMRFFDPKNGSRYECSVFKLVSKQNTLGISLTFEARSDRVTFNILAFVDKTSKELIVHHDFKKENWRHQRSYPPINKIYLNTKEDGFVSFFPSFNKEEEKIFYIMTTLDEQGRIINQTDDTRIHPETFITKLFHVSDNVMYVEIARVIKVKQPPSTAPMMGVGFGPIVMTFGYSSHGTIYKKRKPQLCKIVF